MSENIKEVRVEMTQADLDAMARPATRRRKRGGAAAAAPSTDEIAMAESPVEKVMPDTQSTTLPAVPNTPSMPTTTTTPAGGAVRVKIQTRKRGTSEAIQPISQAARILPKKRHTIMSKPKLVIQGGAAVVAATTATTTATTTPNTATTTPNTAATTPNTVLPKLPLPLPQPTMTSTPPEAPNKVQSAGGSSSNSNRKRRFTERRLSISVKQDKSTRRQRKHLKRKMRKMTTEEIRAILVQRGVVKPKARIPDDMLRSMMRDLLTV